MKLDERGQRILNLTLAIWLFSMAQLEAAWVLGALVYIPHPELPSLIIFVTGAIIDTVLFLDLAFTK